MNNSKTIKLTVTKEVVLSVPKSWTEKEAKLLAYDLCDCSFDNSRWDLDSVSFDINNIKLEHN